VITKEQVADLRKGDVVELYSGVYTIRGPLRAHCDGSLWLHFWLIREEDGEPYLGHIKRRTLTVISRAPRSLYVNHPRAIPAVGDVVRDAENDDDARTWCYDGDDGGVCWQRLDDGAGVFDSRSALPARLRLLVDGETGMVVTDQPAVDPLAHITEGDPTPEGADADEPCGATGSGGFWNWICTREPRHPGQHIAGYAHGRVLAVWS
jgi:hypothetical protein